MIDVALVGYRQYVNALYFKDEGGKPHSLLLSRLPDLMILSDSILRYDGRVCFLRLISNVILDELAKHSSADESIAYKSIVVIC
jgi:hypothetical protein